MAFFRNSVAACVRQETGQRKHRTSLSEQPVCRDSPPRSELSLLCVCSFTSVNALLQHACFFQHNHCYFQGGTKAQLGWGKLELSYKFYVHLCMLECGGEKNEVRGGGTEEDGDNYEGGVRSRSPHNAKHSTSYFSTLISYHLLERCTHRGLAYLRS